MKSLRFGAMFSPVVAARRREPNESNETLQTLLRLVCLYADDVRSFEESK